MIFEELTERNVECSGCGQLLRARTKGPPGSGIWLSVGRTVRTIAAVVERVENKDVRIITAATCWPCTPATAHQALSADSWRWPG